MKIVNLNGTPTVTSLELVGFINSQRGEGEAELRHRDFCAKVPKVLGEEMCEKFRASFKDAYGRDQPGYRFPKREACLMAMSYSYELQAKVFDRMTALESGQQLATIKDPQLAAMVTMLTQLDAVKQEQVAQRSELADIRAKLTATPDEYYTVAGYASLRGISIDTKRANLLGRKASKISKEHGIDIGKAHSAIHGTVNTYHVDILCEVFG
jgi:hypothetical protein